MPDVVVIDTCVLISNVLRRLLLHLAGHAYFKPAWSPIIGDEWQRNAARIWDVPLPDIQDQWAELQRAFPDADQGDVAIFKAGLSRSDAKDWHVIAAARAARAKDETLSVAVLTRNIKDFNRTELRNLGLSLFDPDQFLVRCWAHNPDLIMRIFRQMAVDIEVAGGVVEPLEAVLKRERLFRLNRLCSTALASA
ncbi:MAG TPA: PIN domain-containing protein [Eoetvoesiella sp.]